MGTSPHFATRAPRQPSQSRHSPARCNRTRPQLTWPHPPTVTPNPLIHFDGVFYALAYIKVTVRRRLLHTQNNRFEQRGFPPVSVYELIFSPAGGTKKVAHTVASTVGGLHRPHRVDLCDHQLDPKSVHIKEHDTCIIAVPSFGGRVPAIAAERLARFAGNGANAVLIVTYGNRAFEDTLVELADIAQAAGFKPVAGIAAIAEHSIAKQFAAGRPDAQDLAELESFAKEISAALKNGASAPAFPGNRPYKEFGGSSLKPVTLNTCRHCGFCHMKCPVQAIPENVMQSSAEKCISCMRCVSICPVDARVIDSAMLAGVSQMLEAAGAGERKANELFLA